MRRAIYTSQLGLLEGIKTKLQKQSRLLLMGKLISFSLFAYLGWMFLTSGYPLSYGLPCLIVFVVYVLVMVWDSKLQKQINFLENKGKCLNEEIMYLDGDFSAFDNGGEFLDPEHPFSYDLDVFGDHSFFHRINRTISGVGKEQLAQNLSELDMTREQILERSAALQELANKEAFRQNFAAYGRDVSFDLKRLLNDQLVNSKKSKLTNMLSKVILLLTSGVTIVSFLLAIFDVIPPSIPGFLFAFQILISILYAKSFTDIEHEIGNLFKGFKSYRNIFELIDKEQFKSKELSELKEQLFQDKDINVLSSFGRLANILSNLDQRANLVIFIFTNGLYMRDLWLIRSYYKWKSYSVEHLKMWVEALGKIDALISMATYAYNHPECNYAEISEGLDPVFEADECYHPFLAKEVAVPNSFNLRERDFAIVTGANMAGKSTFLRSLGLNVILALNGIPICANSLKISVVKLFSSMRTSDNLVKNMSYFNAELTRLGNLITYCKSNKHTLIILDEILKGTNSKDKLNGSRLFLSEISKLPVTGIIATHDLGLSELSEQNKQFVNYCFEIELADEINYTYKMTQGVARNMNATHLLEQIISKISSK